MRANRSHTRSRTGCLTCRRRRKKCDERKPNCANCERNNLECAGYQAPVKWTAATTPGKKRACGPAPAGTDTERQNNPPASTTASPGQIGVPPRCSSLPSSHQLPFLINGIRTADDKRLLHHFTHTLSPKLVLHPEPAKNPFNKTILPLALHDEQDWGLFDLMLSFAASHLVRILLKESGQRPTDETRHLENIKWIRYGHGIMRHAKNLSSILDHGKKKSSGNNTEPSERDDTQINYALATTMLLCQWCTCEGGDQSPWRLHLDASRELVRRKVESRRGIVEPLSDASQMFLEWFFFHNVISMVTFPRPSFNIDLQSSRTAATVGNNSSASSDTLPKIFNPRPISEILWIGPNDGLLEILERILALRHELPEQSCNNDFDVKQFFEVLAIEDALREWSFNYINSQQRAVGASYQCAAYIMLYFTLYRTSSASDDPNVRSWVSSLMQHLAAISETDNAQTCALFPLFICGVTVNNPRNRQFVIGKVQAYSRWSGMGYIEDVAGFLMDWWQEQDRMDAARATCGNEEDIGQSTPSWWAWEYFMRQRGLQLILI